VPLCGHGVNTIGGEVLPCGLPRGHDGHHLNLIEMRDRCESQIRAVIQHGAMAAERGDIQDGWFADKTLRQLRAMKADIEAKIVGHNNMVSGAGASPRTPQPTGSALSQPASKGEKK